MGGDAGAPPPPAAIKPLSPSGRHFKTISSGSPCKQGHDPKHAPLAKWALFWQLRTPKWLTLWGREREPEWPADCITGEGVLFLITAASLWLCTKRCEVVITPKCVSGRELSAPTTTRLQEKVTLRKKGGCVMTSSTYLTFYQITRINHSCFLNAESTKSTI